MSRPLLRLVRNNLVILVVIVSLVLALAWPAGGCLLSRWHLVPGSIFAIFLCQGARLDLRELTRLGDHARTLLIGAFVAFVAGPLVGLAVVTGWGWQGADRAGLLVAACMAPTLVSGTVLATRAGGDRSTALILTVALNLLAVVTIPITLRWLLGAGVQVDAGKLLRELLLEVLLPAVLGLLARQWQPARVARQEPLLEVLPALLLGLTFYGSYAVRAEQLREVAPLALAAMLPPCLIVHYGLFGAAYAGGRLLGVEDRRRRSLTIVGAQKSLPLALAICTTAELAARYPLALLVPMVFHFGQVYGDAFIARRWSGGKDAAPPPSAAGAAAEDGP